VAKTKPVTVPPHMNAAIWKAFSAIVSSDVTRRTICHVHVRDVRTIEATDGHCAVQVTFPADLELAPGLYDARQTLARVKAGVAPELAAPFIHESWTFPNIDAVMPSKCEGFSERSDVGFDPVLVGRVMNAVDDILQAVGVKHAGITWDTSDDLSPALVYGEAAGVKVRCAIMPMRVNEPRKRPQKDTFETDAAVFGLKADLQTATKRAAYLDSVVSDLRAEIVRLTEDLNEAREAADTDAADAMRARETVDELRAEINALRHLRPKGDTVAPILLSSPIVRA
jgi:outer membrane murein-binding lipoprotein Lpp